MSKRRRDDVQLDLPPTKRYRDAVTSPLDRLSSLSDELLLHILSFLPISSLNGCQRLSRRFHTLAGDSELWKRQYYSQWVRPRARRLANVTRSSLPPRVEYSPKVSTWLDHSHLAEEGKATNWKGQYRLRHNWSTGVCRVTEVEFPHPPAPPVLVKLCAGVVFTADTAHGLRAWCAKDPAYCLAKVPFPKQPDGDATVCPTALAVSQLDDELEIVVGFDDGYFNRYVFDMEASQLRLRSVHIGFKDGAITAMALSSPYLLIVSQHKTLSLYNLPVSSHVSEKTGEATKLRKLASLNAANMAAPMTLSLRTSGLEIVATIVYSFFNIGCGWSLGIQELRFSQNGQQVESRLASTVDSQYGAMQSRNRTASRRRHSVGAEPSDGNIAAAPIAPSIMHPRPPTSMSYSHPYLLTSHADNTLTMYLVVSDHHRLFVRGGQRLWGHTSSVSAVQVTNRGKAVSVSSRGDEIRIWELEPAVRSRGSRRLLQEDNSIQVSPENKDRDESELESAPRSLRGDLSDSGLDTGALDEVSVMHGCVGFDDERVLLLREKTVGTQLLECYDFT